MDDKTKLLNHCWRLINQIEASLKHVFEQLPGKK